ncbi:MAG: peptide deformylase [Thermodesulfobacteriota bacterium]
MTLREILIYPDPRLREKASPIEEVDEEIKTLMDDMVETMREARGVGLAATQVGVAKRVIVLELPEEVGEGKEGEDEEDEEGGEEDWGNRKVFKFVNPEIVEAEGETKYEEGCLSVPEVRADVRRASQVLLRALDEEGSPVEVRAGGLFAIALQHEIDHLDGVLFIDRLGKLKRELIKKRIKKVRTEEEEKVAL